LSLFSCGRYVAHRLHLVVGERTLRVVVECVDPAVLVIDRHPEVAVDGVVAPRRHHREARHHPRSDAPVVLAFLGVAPRADEEAAVGLGDLEEGPQVVQVVLVPLRSFEQGIALEPA
jgi:hypothetical protein